jgi:hypothetical protein
MKRWLTIFVLAAMPAFAQQTPNTSAHPVLLNTAERVALQNCEKTKQDIQKQWQEIVQQEQAIIAEFETAHPGYHINQQTFAVEPDQPKVKPVSPVNK